MAVQVFSDLYISECERCGVDLEDWDWREDEMIFHTTCTCGTEYRLEPTMGVLSIDAGDILDDDDDDTEADE